jgi:integrase
MGPPDTQIAATAARPVPPVAPVATPASAPTPLLPVGTGRSTVILTNPSLPLQFPSLEHADDRITSAISHAQAVNNLTDATCKWVRKSYGSFRRYLKETRSDATFLGGDIRRQVRIAEGWIAWLRMQEVSQVTINTYWRGLRLLFRWLQEADGSLNPLVYLHSPRVGRILPRFLTKESAETLLVWLRNYPWSSPLERTRNLATVSLMLMAGLRRMEVVKLQFADVNTTMRTIRIQGGKGRFGGKDRTCYMPPQLASILDDYMRERGHAGRTHPTFITDLRHNRGIGAESVRRLCERISRESGIRVRPHALRHTYATLLRMSGVPDRVAMDLLGHSSYAMLQRYSHVYTGEHQREAAKLHFNL